MDYKFDDQGVPEETMDDYTSDGSDGDDEPVKNALCTLGYSDIIVRRSERMNFRDCCSRKPTTTEVDWVDRSRSTLSLRRITPFQFPFSISLVSALLYPERCL